MILFGLTSHELKYLGKKDLILVEVSGLFLSLHFATFILAVKETTIANATFLVYTSPVILAVLSPLIIKERTTTQEGLSVIMAMLGILLVANAGNGFTAFGFGDMSALMAAVFVAVYSLAGRYLRTRSVSTACYTSYVYSVATIVSLGLAEVLGAHTFRGYDTANILAIVGLAIVPTTLGHSLYNYSLKSVKAVSANLFPLLEPIIASLLAVPLFGEVPSPIQIAGYFLILASVVIVVASFR